MMIAHANQTGSHERPRDTGGAELSSAVDAASGFVGAVEALADRFQPLFDLLHLFTLTGEAQTDDARLEALVRRILLGDADEGGLLLEALQRAFAPGDNGEPNPLVLMLQDAVIAGLTTSEDDDQPSPLARAVQAALVEALQPQGEDDEPGPVIAAIDEAVMRALQGTDENPGILPRFEQQFRLVQALDLTVKTHTLDIGKLKLAVEELKVKVGNLSTRVGRLEARPWGGSGGGSADNPNFQTPANIGSTKPK